MKKFRWLAVLTGLFLLIADSCFAKTDEPLPAEIRDMLTGMEITDTAFWEGTGSTWFVMLRTPDKKNTLVCFTQNSGTWVQSFHTSTAVPQGGGKVVMHITDKVISSNPNRSRTGPILLFLQTGTGIHENSVDIRTSYLRSDSGNWELFDAFFCEEQARLQFEDGSFDFLVTIDQDHDEVHTFSGTFDRDLRTMDFSSIPKTLKQVTELMDVTETDVSVRSIP